MKLIQIRTVGGKNITINTDHINAVCEEVYPNKSKVTVELNNGSVITVSESISYNTVAHMMLKAREDVILTPEWLQDYEYINSEGESHVVCPADFDEFSVTSDEEQIRLHWAGEHSKCRTYVPYDEGFVNHLIAIGMKQAQ